ncbi:mechanosensitive ion channel protein MscL [Bowdeniella nasicola]|uniref:Large-conductance mechanosensitive channel n=1 Tax=Bowdeniella nasicola TaxID=208480 RepID=A0A1Q5Q4J8_9ACTO|nr:large conductance mechanosensitive channel protein MscL [Bowdeniella nasicola]OKL54758.1 mechanosensitive ion channel protein MscL [Bowdeniella nasicola]
MLQGFKEFISRGNAMEMAVGIVIGAAFGKVVEALVEGIINPLIGGLFGDVNFASAWAVKLGPATISFGLVINAIIYFLLVALAIYFLIVVPMNKMAAMRKAKNEEPEAPADDVRLLEEIRDLLAKQQPPM